MYFITETPEYFGTSLVHNTWECIISAPHWRLARCIDSWIHQTLRIILKNYLMKDCYIYWKVSCQWLEIWKDIGSMSFGGLRDVLEVNL